MHSILKLILNLIQGRVSFKMPDLRFSETSSEFSQPSLLTIFDDILRRHIVDLHAIDRKKYTNFELAFTNVISIK